MRDNDPTRYVVLAFAAAVTLAACGGSTVEKTLPPPPQQLQRDYSNYYPPGTHRASREAVRVITRWSNELRAGHVRRAAGYFAVPALVQNASPLTKLGSKAEVFAWNHDLPCGAHVVKTLAGKRYTVATFVLTERPGAERCGATGKLAATAFLVDHGKITEWRRVLVPPPLGPARNLGSIDPDAS